MRIEFDSIGHVSNSVDMQKDDSWGSVVSTIEFDEPYQEGLTGLSDFSHVLVVYYLDQARFDADKHLIRRPRNRKDLPPVGIFAQRAKNRPNPIGITAVELIAIKHGELVVKGLDAINGTPVLDIKPYFPQYDMRENTVAPEWAMRLMENYF
jgi:tRNA-Thr(GGU) m(6)t(6)A37 methyltransferase TsaA